MLKKIDVDLVLHKLNKGLDCQFEGYSYSQMIDDCDLTPQEAAWGKQHTAPIVIIIGEGG